jgi:predicted nucleic acid-binding protein
MVVANAGPLISLAAIGKLDLLGLRMMGTSDILLMAREAGLIPTIRPILDELRQTDFRMSDRVYQEVLLKAGEV